MENEISLDNLEEFDCVQVIRCKDCRFSEESDLISHDNKPLYYCMLDKLANITYPQWEEDAFCSYSMPKIN